MRDKKYGEIKHTSGEVCVLQEVVMWFYELNGRLRRGLKIDLVPEPRVVIGGLNCSKRMVLPLGSSLSRLIVGDDADKCEAFILKRGELRDHNGGLTIVGQPEEETISQKKAMVVVNFPLEEEDEGEHIEVEEVRNSSREFKKHWEEIHKKGYKAGTLPDILHETNKLLLFKMESGVGNEAVVRYVSQSLPTVAWHLKWDGRVLHCRRAGH